MRELKYSKNTAAAGAGSQRPNSCARQKNLVRKALKNRDEHDSENLYPTSGTTSVLVRLYYTAKYRGGKKKVDCVAVWQKTGAPGWPTLAHVTVSFLSLPPSSSSSSRCGYSPRRAAACSDGWLCAATATQHSRAARFSSLALLDSTRRISFCLQQHSYTTPSKLQLSRGLISSNRLV